MLFLLRQYVREVTSGDRSAARRNCYPNSNRFPLVRSLSELFYPPVDSPFADFFLPALRVVLRYRGDCDAASSVLPRNFHSRNWFPLAARSSRQSVIDISGLC